MNKLGKYEILEQIGQGAMGVVYKARDPFIERIVAVKTMCTDLDADPELRSRFFREARSAGQLSHKNIVTIYELGEESGKAYMAMEFLDGRDIKERISSGERIPLEDRLRYMSEIAEGLSHAHKKGVFHRDIKPGNIYVTNTGQVKILDFGLARIASSDMTRTGSVIGTPNYMSPEQIRGITIDNRSDIFSAGATFYELLTYRKPFNGGTLQSTFLKILQEDPQPLEAIDPSIPPEFSTVILKAVAKEPAHRYQTADELLQDLLRLEKTLQQHKRKAKEEAREAVEMLQRLVTHNRELLKQDTVDPTVSNLQDRTFIRSTIEHDDARLYDEAGFFDIIEVRDTARREHHRLEILLQKQREAESLLTQAKLLEREDRLEKALELIQKVLIDFPRNSEAIAYSIRIDKMLSDRARAEARDAIRELEELINENEEYFDAKEHSGLNDLKAGILLAAVSGRSNDLDATISIHSTEQRDEILRIRDKARAEKVRLESVLATKKRILARLQEAKDCEQKGNFEDALRVTDELLKELPTHTEAQALVGRVRVTFTRHTREEEKKRQVVELLRRSWRLFAQEKLQESLTCLNEALGLDKSNPEVLAFLRRVTADIEEEKQRPEGDSRANALFQEAADLRIEEEHRALARERAEREKRDRITANVVDARNAESSGAWEKARSLAHAVLEDDSAHVEARELLARVEQAIQRRREFEQAEKHSRGHRGIPSPAMWLGVFIGIIAIGLLIWVLIPKSPSYDQQIASGRSLLEQKQFEEARDVLQQIPSNSALHAQAQDLINQTREAEKKNTIERLVAETSNLRRQGNNEKSLATARQVLELDPSNAAATSLRDEIERENFEAKSEEQRTQYVNATLATAEQLFRSGDFERARQKTDEVLVLRPENPKASTLRRTILVQLEASNNANSERARTAQAKASAQTAKAPELASSRFAAAQRAENTASHRQEAKQSDQAAKLFAEATGLYVDAEKEARAENQLRTDRERENQQKAATPQAQEAVRSAQVIQPAPAPGIATSAAPTTPAGNPPVQTSADRSRQQATAAQNDEAERQAIRSVVERYRIGYESRNIADVRAVFPGINGREETVSNNNFKLSRSVQMKLIEREIRLSGETATAAYEQQIEMKPKTDNKTVVGQASIVFSLGKRGGSWIILDISR